MASQLVKDIFTSSLSNSITINEFVLEMRNAGIKAKFGTFVKKCNLVTVSKRITLVKPILEDMERCFSTVELKANAGILLPQGISLFYVTDRDLCDFNSMESQESYGIGMEESGLLLVYAWPRNSVHILDLPQLSEQLDKITQRLAVLLESKSPKYVYNCHQLFERLKQFLWLNYRDFNNISDIQETGQELSSMIKKAGLHHYLKDSMNPSIVRNRDAWLHRPIHRDLLTCAALDAYCIHQIAQATNTTLRTEDAVYRKSDFFVTQVNLEIECDTEAISESLWPELLQEIEITDTDLFLDIGKKIRLNRHSSTRVIPAFEVSEKLVHEILAKHSPGKQNRAIIGSSFHRLSRMMYDDKIAGLTWRIGRRIKGLEPIFHDKIGGAVNVLLCGPPNVGKTSLIRALCQNMARERSLCLIDTSGEVCGGGPLGDARVFKPCDPHKQYELMIDIIKNHSPSHMVIDEIHTMEEMKLCSTISKRGVKVIASVHGLFEELIYNPQLNVCFGGIHKIVLSDKRAEASGRKTRIERLEKSLFDVVIQLDFKEDRFQYCFITEVNDAVDKVLDNQLVHATCRYLVGDRLYEKTLHIGSSDEYLHLPN
ncbi:hypothetical protein K493DRAFT_295433 [Basidiobolus meristosporus CBS 931.73]|uniref:AAA+ ATPase domain-containing protein n=1 Tax=Basidiobolus meristosporus CBS 931.73 TaxID=1314790 RepID=A0A1Y1ZBR9_9FUNG|nr:hypothetical protein K493DRAFT_295433 [Basidiobolus meristosporus CBS 931.73]|eukprot:ORY07626.1 hypothetical protein K493DRAFT_295433 [Basidiobolus meristosporus CBS 931.73]